MNRSKWLVLAVALGMMAATGAFLVRFHQRVHLGAPGVKVGPVQIFDEHGLLVARQGVLLPEAVLRIPGTNLAVTRLELGALPKDTTFGRKIYSGKDGFHVMTSAVLMGTDRSSIHQPQFCLEAQDWQIEKTEPVLLPMDRPYAYQLPALKLTAARFFLDEHGHPVELRGIYIYWFVTAEKISSEQGQRMWSIARTMLTKGELERWAYISYFATCLPGQEEATCAKLERFIGASVPEFQTVAGAPLAGRLPVAERER